MTFIRSVTVVLPFILSWMLEADTVLTELSNIATAVVDISKNDSNMMTIFCRIIFTIFPDSTD